MFELHVKQNDKINNALLLDINIGEPLTYIPNSLFLFDCFLFPFTRPRPFQVWLAISS